MGVGGSGVKVVVRLGAGVAAATARAVTAAGVSGSLVSIKNTLAEKAPNECQAGLRRGLSVEIAAGMERAGRPDGRNREANEEAPVTTSIFTELFAPKGVIQPYAIDVRHGIAYMNVSRAGSWSNGLFVYQLEWAVNEEKPVRTVFCRVAYKFVMDK